MVTSVLDSAQQPDIHHDCAVMNKSKLDQYNPIRHTVSLGSKASSDLRDLSTMQYANIEPCCSCDSSIPFFDTPPVPQPEYQQSFIVIALIQSISI